MEQEARAAPDAVQRFLDHNQKTLYDLGSHLRKLEPDVTLTSARGSSDHAAGYFKYLSEILCGVPCASVGASVVSVYRAQLKLRKAVCFTVTQSGQSPDIVHSRSATTTTTKE